jgi:4-aminobutyrate aminotransferase-like enzyme/aminoglycoside phosphotransferase (APT) family kinase protein
MTAQARPEQELMGLSADPPEISAEAASRIARELFGLDGVPEPERGERDRNFRIRASDGRDVMLKFSHPKEDPAVVDFQIKALTHIAAQDPVLPVPRIVPCKDGKPVNAVPFAGGGEVMVRALTYLPGQILWDCARTPDLLYRVGATLARLDRALRGFFHPAANQKLAWDLMRSGELAPFAGLIRDESERSLVTEVLDRFVSEVRPRLTGLRGQVIHNDANLGNLVVCPGAPSPVTGVIDFGDMLYGPLVGELTSAGADSVLEADDPLAAAAALVSGYHAGFPLEDEELSVLHDAIMTRLAVTLAIAAWRKEFHGEEQADLEGYDGPCRRALEQLMAIGPGAAEARFREACGSKRGAPSSPPPDVPEAEAAAEIRDLRERRSRLLGAGLSLTYSEPLHIVRGEGVWLYDAAGKAYLDAYNNVPHVGHCHPHVVAAVSRQAAVLNTNTRYLHRTILDYCERLTALMPEGLEACVFVNSGSEANDAAWQMAKAYTGHGGALIVENAYHGVTDAIIAMSPEEFENVRLQPHVRAIEPPDTYRGRIGAGEGGAGPRYAEDADRAIAELAADGHRPAAFIIDASMSSSGILDVPQGYLPAVADKVRAAGGLLIADEVQFGFGRPGSHFWGFELLGATPDIVTLGKPIGNGHPLGVVVTRPEILSAFTAEAGFFSTFGGNPVSCAAGLAVLEVLERERLQENAARTGGYLLERLRRLAEDHALIGDVRGSGLLIGVELVRNRETREPAGAETARTLDLLCRHGVLVGRTGEHDNILKIRPPMPFGPTHADQLVAALDQALREV